MARGFLSGAIWGTVLSVGALGTLSVLDTDQVDQRDSLAEAVRDLTRQAQQEADAQVDPTEAEGGEAQSPDTATDDPAETEEVSESEAPTSVAETDAGEADTAPETAEMAEVQTGEAAEAPVEPEEAPTDTSPTETATAETAPVAQGTSEPARRPTAVDDVTADTTTPVLDTPTATDDTAPDDVVAAPKPKPETGDVVAALDAPSTGAAPEISGPSGSDTAPDAASAPSLTVPDGETGLSISTEPAQPPAPPVPAADSALEPEADAPADAEAPDAQAPAEPDAEPAPSRPTVRVLVPDTPEPDTDVAETDAAANRPTIGRPAGSLIDRDSGSARLPTIGATAAPDPQDTAETPSATDTRPALERYAASSASDPALPKMAIVLIDDGTGPLGPESLDNFPFPVTFALDPGNPESAQRMAAYRALGYEVATLVDVPEAAQPTDVEQILAGAIAMLPETVALIEAPGGGLQSARSSTEQATSFAADSGHGLVFLPNGLNTAQAIAQRADVPSTSILRDFDGDGQDARTKRRFLDGAAFRARQDGAAVMLGRLTPDTVSALLLWSLQDRASSVSMVPVSTILMAPQG
ncbi:divergent polysaccharide deacetylase family protein [Marivita sp. S6314]|uniref:divergent polysaccharide deacetylase family protein n=1 Tax=Marivita sp. S6314 TaxID=2926406 RepID=UPI001FF159FD|nr:divergent polysaccharide deacetylase family protein [Marivita sp. S6314]MCK0150983.1 divergent polysaccharide deacetylase family protein [Marivita sp. S6314]